MQIRFKKKTYATLHLAISEYDAHNDLIAFRLPCMSEQMKHNLSIIFQDQAAEAVPTLPAVPAGEIAKDVVLPEVPKEKLPSEFNVLCENKWILGSELTDLSY